MGSYVSKRDNDEVVDELCSQTYISSKLETLLRIVDRVFFADASDPRLVYNLSPVINGIVHISSPSIYAVALSSLEITPGLKFLNIGSGSGYLSTIVGFLLGTNGTNHGIELNKHLVTYSRRKVKEFMHKNPFFDMFEFCKPNFSLGNAFHINLNKHKNFYDRIYCGAKIPVDMRDFFIPLLSHNGIMIVPHSENFLMIKKDSQDNVTISSVLDVSFASMIRPIYSSTLVDLPKFKPPKLVEICRSQIRQHSRERITEHLGHDYVPLRRCYSLQPELLLNDRINFEEVLQFEENEDFATTGDALPYSDLMKEYLGQFYMHKPLRDYVAYYRSL